MNASEQDELRDILDRIFDGEFGQRATHREVYQRALESVPEHIRAYLQDKAISGAVSQYFSRKRDDGLPFAPVINDDGQHAPSQLWTFDDFGFVAASYVQKATPLLKQARRVAAIAFERFGRHIVVEGVVLDDSESKAS